MYAPTGDSDAVLHYVRLLTSMLATKMNAIVGGQTSCKAPEIAALEEHLPADVDIVPCHSLHGPNVDPKGQPLVRPSLLIVFNVVESSKH